MASPSIQISDNGRIMKVFWEVDTSGLHSSYTLYWDDNSGFASPTQLGGTFINSPDTTYSNKHIIYRFSRDTLGVSDNTGFYLRLTGALVAGGTDYSSVKYVPALNEDVPANNVARLFGYDPSTEIWRKVVVVKDSSSEGGNLQTDAV